MAALLDGPGVLGLHGVYRSAATGQAVYLPLQARGSTPQLPGGQCRPFGQRTSNLAHMMVG